MASLFATVYLNDILRCDKNIAKFNYLKKVEHTSEFESTANFKTEEIRISMFVYKVAFHHFILIKIRQYILSYLF